MVVTASFNTFCSVVFKKYFFIFGLALRFLMVFSIVPATGMKWFVPFLQSSWPSNILDPWTVFIQSGGDPSAFPYGIVMYFALLPSVWLDGLLHNLFFLQNSGTISLGLIIILYDFVMLFTLYVMNQNRINHLLVFYWLSPVVLYVCYWHGQLDLLPILLLMIGLYWLKKERPTVTAILVAAAISAKLSMLIATPLVFIYLFSNKRLQYLIPSTFITMITTLAIFQIPLFISTMGQTMVFGTPEFSKIYDVAINLRSDLQIYVMPFIYLLFLYFAWSIRRINFELLMLKR